jgi:hypothetical protein
VWGWPDTAEAYVPAARWMPIAPTINGKDVRDAVLGIIPKVLGNRACCLGGGGGGGDDGGGDGV